MPRSIGRHHNVLPGFGLSLGYTISWTSLIVLVPLSTLVLMSARLSWSEFWGIVTADRTLAAYRLSVFGALAAALVNTLFGAIIAWVLVRYRFPGRRVMDALIDLPFALPTAVAGIALTAIYADTGWLGRPLAALGIHAAYSRTGVIIAMILVSIPFVVRTVQPVLEQLDHDVEEAAASLGAAPWTIVWRVIIPPLLPALLTGLALSFAKAMGEYGSIIFISSNMPGSTEIAPLLIMNRLEEFNYPAATAIAVGMLAISFVMLLLINLLQAWTRRTRPALTFLTGPHTLTPAEPPAGSLRRRLALFAPRAARAGLIGAAWCFLGTMLVLPLAVVAFESLRRGVSVFAEAVTSHDSFAAVRLTLLTVAWAVPLNAIFGIAAAWAIVRFEFRGRSTLLTIIDLPFSVSPVIAGMIFVLLFGARGIAGPWLMEHGIRIVFATPAIVLATIFVTFPFVARELIPLMQSQGRDDEEAALSLGASGWAMFRRVTLPNIRWGLLYGVILCNARAMGEFGAVSVVSGKIRGETNTMPLHVEDLYNQYQTAAAFSVASLLVVMALLTLVLRTVIEHRLRGESSRDDVAIPEGAPHGH